MVSREYVDNWLISALDCGAVNFEYSTVTMLPKNEELNWLVFSLLTDNNFFLQIITVFMPRTFFTVYSS